MQFEKEIGRVLGQRYIYRKFIKHQYDSWDRMGKAIWRKTEEETHKLLSNTEENSHNEKSQQEFH